MKKEIRGGLQEKEANNNFLYFFIGLLVISIFFGIFFYREGSKIIDIIIGLGVLYLIVLYILIRFSNMYVIDEKGVTITYNNFKSWTKFYPWEEYEEIKIESAQFGGRVMDLSKEELVMIFCKKKRRLKDFIFSGNVIAICTEENYALVKEWIPESLKIPKVQF